MRLQTRPHFKYRHDAVAVIIIAMLAAVMLGGMLTLHAADKPAVVDGYGMPPITAVADYSSVYGRRVGSDIDVYDDDGEHYLFLPSCAELSEVKIRYDGEYKLYDPDTGDLYGKGKITTRNFTAGSCYVYEYDAAANTYTRYALTVMKAGNCASIHISLDGGDGALLRINSSHSDVETGSIIITQPDGTTLYDGDLTRMKGHGLTSYEASGILNTKNSYNINIGEKTELIEGAGKSRKWALLRIRVHGSYDPTGISYPVAFYTYNAIVGGKYYNITARYVDLYVNGEYRGVYILTERMDVNGSLEVTDLEKNTICENISYNTIKAKKNTDDPAISAGIQSYSYCPDAHLAEGIEDISGGYVLEIMCGTYGECGFLTREGMFVNIKSPACCTREQVQYIAEYVQQFESALFSPTGYNSLGKHYTDYADIESLSAQTLVYAFYLNWEIYRTSTYMSKDIDGSGHDKLTFGPVWDFESGPYVMYDTTLFGVNHAYTEKQQYIWFQQLWQKGSFMSLINTVNSRMKTVLDQLLGFAEGTDIFALTDLRDTIKGSQEMNRIRWEQSGSFDNGADEMLEALRYRYSTWYDTLWNADNYLISVNVKSNKNADGSVTYTADVDGKYNGDITWYKVGSNKNSSSKIQGATDLTYTAVDGAECYCMVSGANNAYWEGAKGKIFNNKKITMTGSVTESAIADGYVPAEAAEKSELKTVAVQHEAAELNIPDKPDKPIIPVEATVDTSGVEAKTDTSKGGSDLPYIVIASVTVALSLSAAAIFGKRSGKNEKV